MGCGSQFGLDTDPADWVNGKRITGGSSVAGDEQASVALDDGSLEELGPDAVGLAWSGPQTCRGCALEPGVGIGQTYAPVETYVAHVDGMSFGQDEAKHPWLDPRVRALRTENRLLLQLGIACFLESHVIGAPMSIPPEIGQFRNLNTLILYAINVTGHLPSEMANLESLKIQNISTNTIIRERYWVPTNNNFSGLLPRFVNLNQLEYLNLEGNYFSSEIPSFYSELQRLPSSLSQLLNLQELYLGNFNTFEGRIPPDWGNLSSLRVLDPASCGLTGTIPSIFGQLKLICILKKIPFQVTTEFYNLTSLRELDLALEGLTGRIPKCISQLKQLGLLNLFGNKMDVPIPGSIGELPNLRWLGLRSNNFNPELPQNLAQSRNPRVLDVTNCKISSSIPRQLCKGGKLKWLSLTNNSFSGSIPQELGNLTSLA
ncbi:LOW QUALITY PROTEIN: hypothetical protein Cgig2_004258 [Carnegiea gigantea]|uniref:Uncharacterized protein n=1 Tax=Carnegiea gigantea TaxID=171969 RepID=A0A9Q1QHS0_9CARY|nr:LOW QUALITY PROTEIN: hypothetical protein Cgig2_004258 [Carnegiea gigantea]